jgi:hypothetical protein
MAVRAGPEPKRLVSLLAPFRHELSRFFCGGTGPDEVLRPERLLNTQVAR